MTPTAAWSKQHGTGSVVSITQAGAKRYLLHDAQESTPALLSPSQQIKHKYAYDPGGGR